MAASHEQGHSHEAHGSLKSYTLGFILSIVLTIIPLLVVMNGWMEKKAAFALIMVMAVLQFVVQLFFFMHLKQEGKPRYNLMSLLLGLVIVVTIIIGSIWIMTYNQVAQ